MNNTNPSYPIKTKKSDLSTMLIIAALVLIAIGIIFGPTAAKDMSSQPEIDDTYASGLERITSKYRNCLEDADAGLDSNIRDKMAGTRFDRDTLAQDARDQCEHSYHTDLYVLKRNQ